MGINGARAERGSDLAHHLFDPPIQRIGQAVTIDRMRLERHPHRGPRVADQDDTADRPDGQAALPWHGIKPAAIDQTVRRQGTRDRLDRDRHRRRSQSSGERRTIIFWICMSCMVWGIPPTPRPD